VDRVRRCDHPVTFPHQGVPQCHQDDFFIVHEQYRVI
jgi:hypothetical protein